MIDEGYIKFQCIWEKSKAPDDIDHLIEIRNELHQIGLIGVYSELGIGYGNVSQRINERQFIISCSATGHIKAAMKEHFCLVEDYSINDNWVKCKGPAAASSESLTHAKIYECDPTINSVLHVHNLALWNSLLNKLPTTNPNISYGTPEMAYEIERLFREQQFQQEKTIIMAGHEEGIITFGEDVEKSWGEMIRILAKPRI